MPETRLTISMDPRARYPRESMRGLHMAGKLTDAKIARYKRLGYYSEEFREERRKRMNKRKGNWIEQENGRIIYSPT